MLSWPCKLATVLTYSCAVLTKEQLTEMLLFSTSRVMQASRDNAQSRSEGNTGVIHGFWNWIRYLVNCVSQATLIISRGERTDEGREKGKTGEEGVWRNFQMWKEGREKEMVNICNPPFYVCFWSYFILFSCPLSSLLSVHIRHCKLISEMLF